MLVGYTSTSAEGFAVTGYAAAHTERLSYLTAHRPGFVVPTLTARAPATLDHLTNGRIALHIITGPVYRGTFTGALKNLLDLSPIEALRAKPVGIVAIGATPHHYLGVDWQLRAVLAWFGARVVATSVYLESAHFREGVLADPPSRAALADLVNALLDMPTAGGAFGPPPLAAGRG